ncbi:unnamed protein product [Sphagnum balticum]
MEQGKAEAHRETSKEEQAKLNWRLIRKFEGLIFASMLLAVPFFAFRIVDTTGSALMVQNTSVGLVDDLIRARGIARDFKLAVTVSANPVKGGEQGSYVIQNGARTIEQVTLPYGVTMDGSVTFGVDGIPKVRSQFYIHKQQAQAVVEVDSAGKTSVH